MKSTMKLFLCALALTGFLPVCTHAENATPATDNAVILLYHHVAEDTPASTSIRPAQFEAHLKLLKEKYHVAPLKEVLTALKAGEPLPDKTVVITFDDGYDNIFINAHPKLKALNFPYTVFINPAEINHRKNQLSWQQIRQMQKEGASFANHTQDHLHMLERHAGESDDTWLARVWKNVTEAQNELKEKAGVQQKWLAYPFGEYSQVLAEKLEKSGYTGFAQSSGPVSSMSDFSALPRFPAAGPYASLDSLQTKLNSLAMPVTDKSLSDPALKNNKPKDDLWFEVQGEDVRLTSVTCFFEGKKIASQTKGKRVYYALSQPLPAGRSRVNCTAPSDSLPGRYYWYSQPFFIADAEGKYPD